MKKVSIRTGESVYNATEKALDDLNFKIDDKNLQVMVKPNLTKNLPPESGVTTNSKSVKAILERISQGNKIIIGEGSGGSKTDLALREQGYYKLSKQYDTELSNFDKGEIVKRKIEDSFTTEEIPFAKEVLESDFVISAAKLKTHSVTKATLSMKNMFGAVPLRRNKLQYHFRIDRAIPDFMKIIKPDLCVIEGFPGNQGDETLSNPVDSDIVIAGRDPVAVDSVGCRCMGIDPEDVKHIQLMKKIEGNKETNYEIVGENLDDIMREYKFKMPLRTKIRHFIEKINSYVF